MLICFVSKQAMTHIRFLQTRFEDVRRVFFLETLLSTAGLFLTSREGFGDITEDGSHSLRNSETLHGM